MAYKFQLGAFTASGSIKAEDGFDANNANVSNVETGSFSYLSASAQLVAAAIALADASGIIANAGGLENSSGEIQIATGGVTNDMLSGSITNAKLEYSSISGKSLGSNLDALSAGNGIAPFSYNGSATGSIQIQLATTGALEVGGSGLDLKSTITGNRTFSDNITIDGNLTVQGSTTYIDTTNLLVTDAQVVFADSALALADDQGWYIGADTAGTPLASFAVQTADFDKFVSSLPISASMFVSDDWEISSTHISGNLPVSASAFYGDGSNLTGLLADNAETAEQLDFKTLGVLENNGNIVQPFTKVDSGPNSAFTATLPQITSANDGKMYIIKDSTGNCGTSGKAVTIAPYSGQKIDNVAQSIVLESSYAAVTLVAAHNGGGGNETWYII